MSRRTFRRFLRRVGSVLALSVVMVAAFAIFSAPAQAATCDGSSSLLAVGGNCTSVAGITVTTGPTTCVSGTACATPRTPDTNDPGTITQTVSKPPEAPAPKAPVVKKAPPKRPVVTQALPIRIREADSDPAWFTSGSYETTLPYRLPSYLRPFDGGYTPPTRSSARIVDLGSLAAPLRMGLIYAGLGLLAVAVGVRRMLLVR